MQLKTRLHSLSHLLKTYATVAPSIFYRMTFSLLLNPRAAQKFVHEVLNIKDIQTDDSVLGSIDLAEILPTKENVDVAIKGSYHLHQHGITHTLHELSSLAYLVKVLDPHRIFEIGTHVGRTTRLFADLCSDDTEIFTLDLPQKQVSHIIGRDFRDTKEERKITQFHCDSTSFDFSPWHRSCDFIWVDACHDYDYVVSDTEAALQLCKPGGWIGWHDYRHTAWWSGVTRAVRELAGKGYRIHHVRGTTMAVMQLPKNSIH